MNKFSFRLNLILLSILGFHIIINLFSQNFSMIIFDAVIMLLLVAPMLIRRRTQLPLPPEFEIAMAVFVFLSLFLGEVRYYYEKFWWWDVLLHGSAGPYDPKAGLGWIETAARAGLGEAALRRGDLHADGIEGEPRAGLPPRAGAIAPSPRRTPSQCRRRTSVGARRRRRGS